MNRESRPAATLMKAEGRLMTAAGTAGRKAGQEKVSQREEVDDTRLQINNRNLSSGHRTLGT